MKLRAPNFTSILGHGGGSNEPYRGFFTQHEAEWALSKNAFMERYIESIALGSSKPLIDPKLVVERVMIIQGGDVAVKHKSLTYASGGTVVNYTSIADLIENAVDNSEEILKKTINEVRKVHGNVWLGYICSLVTDTTHQVAVIDEDFDTAQDKIIQLKQHTTKYANLIYSTLSESALSKIADKKFKVKSMWQKFFSRLFPNTYRSHQLNSIGLNDCDSMLTEYYRNYCTKNSIHLADPPKTQKT